MKKLVAYHIARLKDKNPDVRLEAIKELELLLDIDALETLQAIYNDDPDETVRRAAQQAGRTIFMTARARDKSENESSSSSS